MTSVPRILLFAVLDVMTLATNAARAQFGVTPEREVRDESAWDLSAERRGMLNGASGERPHERGLRESIVGDALKNALADVIRERSGGEESPRISPVTSAESAAPSAATKEFSYTSIRFKSSDSSEATTARNGDFVDSPLLQPYMAEAEAEQRNQEVEQERELQSGAQLTQQALTLDTSDLESQLNAKLAAIQQEMSELEELKRVIAQLEGGSTSTRKLQMLNDKFDFAPLPPMPKPFADKHARSAASQAKSRLQTAYPDTGIPGWDPLALVDRHGAFVEDDLATLMRNSQEKAARLNILMTETLAMGADSIAAVVGKGGDRQVVRSDLVRSFLDALALEGQEKLGRLQEFFMHLMENKQDRVESLLDKIY